MTGFNVKLDSSAIEVNNTLGGVFANATEGQNGTLSNAPSTFYSHADKNKPQYLDSGISGTSKYLSNVLSAYQKMYFIPYNATSVLIYDVFKKTFNSTTISGLSSDLGKWWGASVALNDKIYCAPYNAEDILVINTKDDSFYTIPIPNGTDTQKYCGCCLDPITKNIVFCPHNANTFLMLNPEDDSIDASISTPTTNLGKYRGIVSVRNGLLYAIPSNETHVARVNTVLGTVDQSVLSGLPVGNSKWAGAAVAINNKVYCAPQNVTEALIIDSINETWALSPSLGTRDFFGAVAAPNNSVYFCPGELDKLAIVDILTDTFSFETVNNPGGWGGFSLDNLGNAIGSPYDSDDILIVPTGIPSTNLDWLVSIYRNKF